MGLKRRTFSTLAANCRVKVLCSPWCGGLSRRSQRRSTTWRQAAFNASVRYLTSSRRPLRSQISSVCSGAGRGPPARASGAAARAAGAAALPRQLRGGRNMITSVKHSTTLPKAQKQPYNILQNARDTLKNYAKITIHVTLPRKLRGWRTSWKQTSRQQAAEQLRREMHTQR